MAEMKSLTLNDKKYDCFVDTVARSMGVINSASGESITVSDSSGGPFVGLRVFGKTTQDGTPSPDAPVELVSVGDNGSITVSATGKDEGESVTLSTPNGLPGIPVASGGNYTDANGQQWVCDEIDFARGVYIARIKKITCAGTERILAAPLGGNYGYFRYRITLGSQYAANIPNTKMYDGHCSHYGRVSADSAYAGKGLNKTAIQLEDLNFYVDFATAESFQVFIQEQYAMGTPVEVQYILATPIETPLSDEDLAAYANLGTYRGGTTITNDAGAWMEVAYVMDAKQYIDRVVAIGVAASRLSSVTLLASKWTGENSLYSQVLTIDGITENSKVDLLPSVEQLAIFHNKDVAFVTENDNGVITVYAIGDKPLLDYTMQVQITEVIV